MLKKLLNSVNFKTCIKLAIVAFVFPITGYIDSTNSYLWVLTRCFLGLCFLIWEIDELRVGNKASGVFFTGHHFWDYSLYYLRHLLYPEF
jgi:hypothetical protein